MKRKSGDSEDIERAVYDGMQDLRTPKPPGKKAKKQKAGKAPPKRR